MKKLGFFIALSLICQSCIIIYNGGKDSTKEKSNYVKVSGKGAVIEKEMDYSNFDKLSLFAPIKVEVMRGDNYEMKIEGHENLISLLNIEVKNETLKINTEKNFKFTDEVKVTLQVPVSLQKVDIGSLCQVSVDEITDQAKFGLYASGESSFYVEKLFVRDIDMDLSGVSKVNIPALKGEKCSLDLKGVSEVQIEGKTKNLSVGISGVSKGLLGELEADNVDCRMSGVCNCEVWATQVLKADVSGVSKFNYRGNPSVLELNTAGKSSAKVIR